MITNIDDKSISINIFKNLIANIGKQSIKIYSVLMCVLLEIAVFDLLNLAKCLFDCNSNKILIKFKWVLKVMRKVSINLGHRF